MRKNFISFNDEVKGNFEVTFEDNFGPELQNNFDVRVVKFRSKIRDEILKKSQIKFKIKFRNLLKTK